MSKNTLLIIVAVVVVVIIGGLLLIRGTPRQSPQTAAPESVSAGYATPTAEPTQEATQSTPPQTASLVPLSDFDRTVSWYRIPQPNHGILVCGDVSFKDPGNGYGYITVSYNDQAIAVVRYYNDNRRLDTGHYVMGANDISGGQNNIAGLTIGNETFTISRDIVTAQGFGWSVLRTFPCQTQP